MTTSPLREQALSLLDEMGLGIGPFNVPTKVRQSYWESYTSVVGIVVKDIRESTSDLILQELEQCTQQAISLQTHTQARGCLSCFYFPQGLFDGDENFFWRVNEVLHRFEEHFFVETMRSFSGMLEMPYKHPRWVCILWN